MPSLTVTFELDAELLSRMAIYNDEVHELDSGEGMSFVVNHFLRLGVAAAEAERDAHTAELF